MKQAFRLFPVFLFILLACRKDKKAFPQIISFTPGKGAFNIMVSIKGNHFDSSIANTSVAFNGASASVVFVNDTLIKVIVPQNATTGRISVTINGTTVNSIVDFIILAGKWTRKADLPFLQGRANGHAFSIGNKGYFMCGNDGGPTKDLYEYDPATNQWTRKADCGIDFFNGICMVINGKVYAGVGNNVSPPAATKELWEYNPALNQWTRKADFPGMQHNSIFGVGSGNKGFAGLGSTAQGVDTRDWWEYDPGTNSWTQKTNNPSVNHYGWLTGFAFNNKIYAGPGSFFPSYPGANEIWEFDPVGNSWVKKTEHPGKMSYLPSAFIIGNKIYIAGGGKECWEYDFTTDVWKQVAFFGDRQGGAAFSIGNKGYFMTGVDYEITGGYQRDLWEFEPAP